MLALCEGAPAEVVPVAGRRFDTAAPVSTREQCSDLFLSRPTGAPPSSHRRLTSITRRGRAAPHPTREPLLRKSSRGILPPRAFSKRAEARFYTGNPP